MHRYQQQHSTQTLAEGIAEYYSTNSVLIEGRSVSASAHEFFRCHDAVHVVFGCDTSLSDEAIVKIGSIFGTSEGVKVLRGYRLPESQEIYRELSIPEILITAVKSVFLVPRTLWRCARMNQRWPWSDFNSHLDSTLTDIRREYGIRVAHLDLTVD